MKKNILKKAFSIALIGAMVFTLGACASKQPTNQGGNTATTKEDTKLDKIKKSGKLVIGTSADYPSRS